MAKKKSKAAASVSSDAAVVASVKDLSPEEEDDIIAVQEEVEYLQVDLGDMVKVKQILDEAVAHAVLFHIEEDHRLEDIKFALMGLACVFAMTAQFAPLPFPDSRPLLGFCGAAYFILSGVLQYMTTFIDKDSIVLTKPATALGEKGKNKTNNTRLQTVGINVRSSLPRFSEWYTITLEFLKTEGGEVSPYVQQKWSIGQFFDKEGYFDEAGLVKEIDELVHRFEEQKYDKAEISGKEKSN